jgi:hypothetical protein
MKKPKLFLLGLVCSLFISCKEEVSRGEEPLPFDRIDRIRDLPGFGESDALPEGIPFELPKGLHLVQRPSHLFDPDLSKLKGKMNTFYVDVHIVADSTWGGGTFDFPAGLVVLSTAPSSIQNGMLIGREPVTFPPYNPTGGKDTLTIYLGVACINAERGLPWADNFGLDDRDYPISKGTHLPYVVTKHPEVLKFLSLFQGKDHLRLTRHHNPWDMLKEDYVEPEWMKPYRLIQDRLWLMTDGPGLNKEDLEELWKVLNKK